MIARAVLMSIALITMFYGLFRLAVLTPFFKDRELVKQIGLRAILILVALMFTIMAMGFVIDFDHFF